MSELNIHQRLHAIMQDVGYIQKESKKVNNQYTFVSHDAVTKQIRPALIKHGVLAIPTFFDISQDGNKTICSVKFTFINIDKPDDKITIECSGFGYGVDNQDKGAGKAMSYAVKYALLKIFSLETGDDPEKDSIEHIPAIQLIDKRKKAEKWAKDYIEKLDQITDDRELLNLQTDNQDALTRLRNNHPDLHTKTIKATETLRLSW